METVFASWQDIPVTENHVKQLHRDLLALSDKDERHRGSYKAAANAIAAFDKQGKQLGVIFETATPYDTPAKMAELFAWLKAEQEKEELHPLLIIGLFTVIFLEIHPFQDGNGRLSRILTTLLLLQAGYAYVPFSSLESVIEQDKEAYYLALRQTQGTIRASKPNWQPWLAFFLQALMKQVTKLNSKIEREKLVLAPMSEHSLKMVEFAREHGRITMALAVRLTGASRNTLKAHFRALVEQGHLKARGQGRGAWYEAS
jgi:Fic family protein